MRFLIILVAPIVFLIVFGAWTGSVTFLLTLWFLINVSPDTDRDQRSADTDPLKPYGPYGILIRRSQHPRKL